MMVEVLAVKCVTLLDEHTDWDGNGQAFSVVPAIEKGSGYVQL